MIKILSIFIIFHSLQDAFSQKPCIRKNYPTPEPAMVCVCNATYCDEFPPPGQLQPYQAAVYVSSISGKRFEKSVINFTDFQEPTPDMVNIKINPSVRYQSIIGFGSAFTQGDGFDFMRLSKGAQDNLLESYYGETGIGYTMGRVPMETCDIPQYGCSYDDVPNDFDLVHFNLTQSDLLFKIPIIKSVLNISSNPLKLFASPWSAPAWMKATNQFYGGGFNGRLKGDVNGPYYQTWAKYFIRFFEEYAKLGIDFWGVTVQNEAVSGVTSPWAAMYMSAEMHRDFIKGLLGPMLRGHNLTKNIFLMIMDDQRWLLPGFAQTVLSDPEAAKYVDGIAVHWYEDFLTDPKSTLAATHDLFPNVPIFYSEACNGYLPFLPQKMFGDWARGVSYASNIIEDFQNWVTGWMDFGMFVGEADGDDSPIIINKTIDEFYKQPMYYVMGHFSKFIRPNSTKIDMVIDRGNERNDLDGVAFVTPTNQHVVVLQNRNMTTVYQVEIQDAEINGKALQLEIEPRSIVTIVWNKIY